MLTKEKSGIISYIKLHFMWAANFPQILEVIETFFSFLVLHHPGHSRNRPTDHKPEMTTCWVMLTWAIERNILGKSAFRKMVLVLSLPPTGQVGLLDLNHLYTSFHEKKNFNFVVTVGGSKRIGSFPCDCLGVMKGDISDTNLTVLCNTFWMLVHRDLLRAPWEARLRLAKQSHLAAIANLNGMLLCSCTEKWASFRLFLTIFKWNLQQKMRRKLFEEERTHRNLVMRLVQFVLQGTTLFVFSPVVQKVINVAREHFTMLSLVW